MDLGMIQKEVARELGVNFKTYENWEQGKYGPSVRHLPAVFRFLGFDPRPEPVTLGERIRRKREGEGLSQRELARKLRLDPTTVQTWEEGRVRKPYPRLIRLFEEYVESA
jgi:transcriptional regulator with XRE-family HTH domain